ncbi:ABC transporter permease [Candidatus Dactylopiibacterium carminicum]|nr:ABC transporter permease [Candidatus Dactylopiibacterium carminicum]
MAPPTLRMTQGCAHLAGDWSLAALRPRLPVLRRLLSVHGLQAAGWDLSAVTRMDSFGALLLWRAWGMHEPASVLLPPALQAVMQRVRLAPPVQSAPPVRDWRVALRALGRPGLLIASHAKGFLLMLGSVVLEAARLVYRPRAIPWREFSAAFYQIGVRALPIAALVGFLIGIVLAYLSALQLRNFGADALIINILGIGILRELGPVLVSILVAGRSGSAITAQLGVMRVTEELDALAVMGVSAHQRLILPKVLAMALVMPLLVLWTSAAALGGGMVATQLQLEIGWQHFVVSLAQVVPVQNLVIGFIKGSVFGVAIALVACHFGLRIQPNTESLSRNTTAAVVAAITSVILLDALLAVMTRGIGVPLR